MSAIERAIFRKMDLEDKIARHCWTKEGLWGDSSCPELADRIHCYNCPAYSEAGKKAFRPARAGRVRGRMVWGNIRSPRGFRTGENPVFSLQMRRGKSRARNGRGVGGRQGQVHPQNPPQGRWRCFGARKRERRARHSRGRCAASGDFPARRFGGFRENGGVVRAAATGSLSASKKYREWRSSSRRRCAAFP